MNPSSKRNNRLFRRRHKVSADSNKKEHAKKKGTKVFHDTKQRKPIQDLVKERWTFFCEEMARDNGGHPAYLAGPFWCAAPYYQKPYGYNDCY